MNAIAPKPFSLIHLQMIDVDTGEKVEFRFLPADVAMHRNEPAEHSLGWPYPVNDAHSYVERMKQIEGPTISLKMTAESCMMTEIITSLSP
jgi:hypothetical protein